MTATAAAVAFIVYSCQGKLGEAKSLKIDETPVQTVRDMFVVQSENGMMQMRASADLMEKYERDTLTYELFPEGFAVYAYTDEGLLETEIVADNAKHMKYKDGRETWEAFGTLDAVTFKMSTGSDQAFGAQFSTISELTVSAPSIISALTV